MKDKYINGIITLVFYSLLLVIYLTLTLPWDNIHCPLYRFTVGLFSAIILFHMIFLNNSSPVFDTHILLFKQFFKFLKFFLSIK